MDIEELVDDFVTFYVAGQETTANLLTFALVLSHLHPTVLERNDNRTVVAYMVHALILCTCTGGQSVIFVICFNPESNRKWMMFLVPGIMFALKISKS